MDVVDLDRVLDEFEAQEDTGTCSVKGCVPDSGNNSKSDHQQEDIIENRDEKSDEKSKIIQDVLDDQGSQTNSGSTEQIRYENAFQNGRSDDKELIEEPHVLNDQVLCVTFDSKDCDKDTEIKLIEPNQALCIEEANPVDDRFIVQDEVEINESEAADSKTIHSNQVNSISELYSLKDVDHNTILLEADSQENSLNCHSSDDTDSKDEEKIDFHLGSNSSPETHTITGAIINSQDDVQNLQFVLDNSNYLVQTNSDHPAINDSEYYAMGTSNYAVADDYDSSNYDVAEENYNLNNSALCSNDDDFRPNRPSFLDLPSASSDNSFASPTSPEEVLYSDLESQNLLGKFKPFWIPDNEAPICMHCDSKFTVIKRRHHCRACGKVLCSQCCNQKAKLQYLENKEVRVCNMCHPYLIKGDDNFSDMNEDLDNDIEPYNNQSSIGPDARYPDPCNPLEYCSTVSPLEQAQEALNRPPPTILVPVGVLKRGDKPKGEPKQVVFSDGIRPGGDLTELDEASQSYSLRCKQGRNQLRLKSPPVESPGFLSVKSYRSKSNRISISDANGPLPAVINHSSLTADSGITDLLASLSDEKEPPIVFYLTKNLLVESKIIVLDCCVEKECWMFVSKGLSSVGQDEIAVILERFPNETSIPRDIFRFFTSVYDSSSRGSPFLENSHILFPEGLFGNKDNSGFLFIRPTFQCVKKLLKPMPPFLIGILLHKCEVPWAKVLPLRLLLRLGVEYRNYPCPLISFRNRKPAYFEVGHTIMNVLADFRSFQYTLPVVSGLVVHLESENLKMSVIFPRNRFDQILKVLNNSNEHVLAFGATFSRKADSHLVCMQNDDGQFQTQVNSLENSSKTITGASFAVFSGALKTSTGLKAKISSVEDGLLIQIPAATLTELKNSLKNMKDFTIECGKLDNSDSGEQILLIWGDDDISFNLGVVSPIDNKNLEGVENVRIYNGTDYAGDEFIIRWTEVFLIDCQEQSRRRDSVDPTRLAGVIAQALCLALTPHLEHLVDKGFWKVGLRVTLDPDRVGYDVGSNCTQLPAELVNELDSALIPIIMGNIASNIEGLLVMELIFHILVK